MKNRLKQAKLSTTYVLMLYKMPFKITGLGQAFQQQAVLVIAWVQWVPALANF